MSEASSLTLPVITEQEREDLRRHGILLTSMYELAALGRSKSVWPLQFGLACCAIEMIAASMARFDIARFGSEVFRPSPRQADLLIVSGTVTKKMAPQVVRLWNQMPEPKYCIAMGACAISGGPFKEGYNVVSGIDEFIPVDVYARGCPPTPQALLNAFIELQKKIDRESYIGAWKRRRRPEIPVPILGADLIDQRQLPEIRDALAKKETQRLQAPKETPAFKPAPKLIEVGALDAAASGKTVGEALAAKFPGKVQAHAKNGLVIRRSVWLEAARSLTGDHGLDYLANVSSADYADSYEVAYHFYNTRQPGPAVNVKVRADKANPDVPSVTSLWAGADFQEREVYDLMGVRFAGHPNLKRILMWDGFAGHPLRKDYLEPYYEEPRKMFSSRWKEGHHKSAEDRNRWGRNVVYPEGLDADGIKLEEAPSNTNTDAAGQRRLLVSMGPQHPSTRGVFQMKVLLEGERVVAL